MPRNYLSGSFIFKRSHRLVFEPQNADPLETLKKLFIDLEIDGIFTDFPDQIRAYLDKKTATPVKDNSREEGLSQEE